MSPEQKEKNRQQARLYYQLNRESILQRKKAERAANPEKFRQIDKRDYELNKERYAKKFKRYYDQHKVHLLENRTKWGEQNREHLNEAVRERRKANPERLKAANSRAYAKNPLAFKVNARNRKARLKKAEGRFTAQDINALIERQEYKCFWCQYSLLYGYHVDHIIPIIRGGSNWPHNLCLACPSCNLRKSSKHPEDFIFENADILDRERRLQELAQILSSQSQENESLQVPEKGAD